VHTVIRITSTAHAVRGPLGHAPLDALVYLVCMAVRLGCVLR
jgi:hypothetical protein